MGKLVLIKKVPFAMLFKDESADNLKVIKLEGCRASYPYVGTPSEDKDDNGEVQRRYRITFQLPKATHGQAKDLIKSLIQELLTANKANVDKAFWFLKDGDQSENESDHGFYLVNAADPQRRPVVRDRRADEVTDVAKIDDMIYGGCWVNGVIRPWYFNGQSKKSNKKLLKRVSCGLQSVQFVKDDTPYGRGRIDDSDVYSTVEEGDGMEDNYATADDDEI